MWSPVLVVAGWDVDFQLNLNTETVRSTDLKDPLCVPPNMSVRDVLVLMKQHNTGCVLVCRNEKLIGIFTQRDVLRLLATEANLATPIESAMAANPVTLHEGDTVGTAIRRMTEGGYRHLPVVDDNERPTGLLKVRGIIHYLVEHFPQTIYNLPPEPRLVAQEREGA
jgi:CBS domain-containing protein